MRKSDEEWRLFRPQHCLNQQEYNEEASKTKEFCCHLEFKNSFDWCEELARRLVSINNE